MAKKTVWNDDYWLLLMQLYLQRPVGMKPLYSREMVNLSMELHIAPQELQARMQQIAQLSTKRIERYWDTYSQDVRKLNRAVKLLRSMKGFGAAGDFYDGVQVEETFEKDFRPLAEDERLMPVMLILVLDLYFQLTPSTMVSQTPEVQKLARLIGLTADEVVQLLKVFQHCDPYYKRLPACPSSLLQPCQQVWQRFGNDDPTVLNAFAAELKVFFK